jgi:hypothetical protein
MNLGTGFVHLEPIGGQALGGAPGHRYRYLVHGQGAPIQFAWCDSSTSDNYGIITITVELANPTDAEPPVFPTSFRVLSCVPNPFNPSTTIRYELPTTDYVAVEIFDVRGRLVRQLYAGNQLAGYQTVRWNGETSVGAKASSGVYYALVRAGREVGTARITLVR